LFEKYKTPEAIWNQAFFGYVKWGDCSAINLYPSHEGYKTILLHNDTQIVSQQSFEEHTLENLDYESFLKKHKKFNFVHIGHAPPYWKPERHSLGVNGKEKYIHWLATIASKVRNRELGEQT
jgi:hypothetical protein